MLGRYLGVSVAGGGDAERRRRDAYEAMYKRPDATPDPIQPAPSPARVATARGGVWRALRKLTGTARPPERGVEPGA